MQITKIDPNVDHFVNARGAVVYRDRNRHPVIVPGTYRVLSVGYHFSGKLPIATCEVSGIPTVYRLPESLTSWVDTCVTLAQSGSQNVFPRYVGFVDWNGEIDVRVLE